MKIKRLRIENFRAIEHFETECVPGANVFVGINGAGKTTLLAAVEILFSWLVARLRTPNGKGTVLRDSDICTTGVGGTCMLEVELGDGTKWSLARQRSGVRRPAVAKSYMRELSDFANNAVERIDAEKTLPLIASYDVQRIVDSVPKHVRKRHATNILDVYDSGTRGRANFNSFFVWFREKEDIENERLRETGILVPDSQLECVRRAVEGAVDGFTELKVRRQPRGFVVRKNGQELRFSTLSDGEQSYIALIADIARKLAMTNPALANPLDGEGIIVVDEIDLHLHPQWQRDVLPMLKRTFPNCQFLVSTHSPFVLSNVNCRNGDRAFVVKDGQVRLAYTDIYGTEVDSVLREVFDMKSLRAEEAQRHINAVWDALVKKEEDKAALQWLRDNLPPADKEFARIELQQRLNQMQAR